MTTSLSGTRKLPQPGNWVFVQSALQGNDVLGGYDKDYIGKWWQFSHYDPYNPPTEWNKEFLFYIEGVRYYFTSSNIAAIAAKKPADGEDVEIW